MTNERGIRAGGAFVELTVVDKAKKVLANIRARLQQFSKDAIEVSNKAAGAAAAILAPLTVASRQFIKLGDEIAKSARQTRLSVQDYQALKFAFEQGGSSGSDLKAVMKGLLNQTENLRRGGKEAEDTFNALGLTFSDLKGLAPAQLFELITKRLAAIEDEALRGGIALKLFRGAGQNIIPVLESIAGYSEEFKRSGLGLSDEQAKEAEQLADAFNLLRKGVQKIAFEIGSALFGSIKNGTQAMSELIQRIVNWIQNNREMIRTVARLGVQLLALAASLRIVGTAAAAISMLGKSTMLLRTSMVALVAVNVAGWMVNSSSAMQDLNAEFSRAVDLTTQLTKLYDKRFTGRFEAIKKETDLETKLAKIAEYRAELEKRRSGSIVQRNQAQQRIRDTQNNRSLLQSAGSVLGINPNDTTADQKLLEEANGRIRQVTEQIEELGKEALRAKINVADLNAADRDSLRKRALSAIPGAERGQVALGISSLGLKVNDPQKISNDLNKKQLETLNEILDELRGSHDGRFMLIR